MINSQSCRAGKPSIRKAAFESIISAPELECDTANCLLHTQLTGTKVRGPTMHKYAPFVDFESSKSPAKLASTNNAGQQSVG